ncbi:MAG: cell wall hydrolase SleB [Anaerocolumna sp.]|jgi:N-acetylmuramoyl-L-alanine amidase|nr:cell wall hydrolase SleB [Anaerocolumna sp.]
MLKIHSFLQRIRKPLSKLIPFSLGKYKIRMAVIAYTMATVLFILSPEYIYGDGDINVEFAKAKVTETKATEISEETANEAIVRTNQTNANNRLILCDLKMDFNLYGNVYDNTQKVVTEGKTINNTLLSLQLNDSQYNYTNTDIANSIQAGADAKDEVDSGSTKDKISVETDNSKIKQTEKTKELKEKSTKTDDKSKEKKKSKKTKKSDKKVVDLSDEEIEILQRIVEAEATGENVKGKILVANVILNRVKDDNFPDTIKEVVFQKDGNTYQFSPIKDKRYWSVTISDETVEAVERVMQGEDYSKGALYFSARSRADSDSMRWFDNNLEFLFAYGGHEFFKD